MAGNNLWRNKAHMSSFFHSSIILYLRSPLLLSATFNNSWWFHGSFISRPFWLTSALGQISWMCPLDFQIAPRISILIFISTWQLSTLSLPSHFRNIWDNINLHLRYQERMGRQFPSGHRDSSWTTTIIAHAGEKNIFQHGKGAGWTLLVGTAVGESML